MGREDDDDDGETSLVAAVLAGTTEGDTNARTPAADDATIRNTVKRMADIAVEVVIVVCWLS
jgi:hypothetical protein